MKKQIITATVLIALAMSTAPVVADGGKGRFMKHFDTNNDGSVDMAEFDAAAAERFKSMDADTSGVISTDEFRSYMRSRKDERKKHKFSGMDSNGNGGVERDEYLAKKKAKAERKFARMDKDGNGSVSKEEYASCKKRKHKKKGGMLKRMDKDGDGQISQKESLTGWSNWFKRIDVNSDQVVTTDEVQAFRNKIHGKSHGGK